MDSGGVGTHTDFPLQATGHPVQIVFYSSLNHLFSDTCLFRSCDVKMDVKLPSREMRTGGSYAAKVRLYRV